MSSMFVGCEKLKTIFIGNGWNTSNVTDSKNCTNLIGGKGTKYDENHTNAEYARIDGGESNPGYFTKK
jgi:surface protein